MAKFMVLYYASEDAMKGMEGKSEEEMMEGMKPWMEWAAKCGDKLVDMGMPLGNGRRVTSEGVTPSTKEISGYSVLEAESMEEAAALLEGHPHLGWGEGCDIEVYEGFPLPGM